MFYFAIALLKGCKVWMDNRRIFWKAIVFSSAILTYSPANPANNSFFDIRKFVASGTIQRRHVGSDLRVTLQCTQGALEAS